jgi:low affinity Fe/Cu permease
MKETLDGMIRAYNETPENFESPTQSTVDEMIRLVEEQMAQDENNELIESLNSIKEALPKTHGST